MENQFARGSLDGVRVVEFAQVIAGPLAGTLMADLGADVVHVESPRQGDALRYSGPDKNGTHLWWKVLGRNKRSVSLDLHQSRGKEVAEDLVRWADVVIVTFRADTAKSFGLDWDRLSEVNPSAVVLQISGYGAATSRRNDPGFGKVGEARSGVVHITGEPDGPPIHTGFSHGDATTALMGAFAVSAALYRRAMDPDRAGEWIDLALYETLFRLVEWQVIVYDQLGMIPERAGNSLPIAPGAVINTFRSEDGKWVTVTSATPRSVQNIAAVLGYDPAEFAGIETQLKRSEELEKGLRSWISRRSAEDAVELLTRAEVVASTIYSIEDIFADPIYHERSNLIDVQDPDLGTVKMQGVVPQMRRFPGRVWRAGPELGQDNELVFGEWLGLGSKTLMSLRDSGVI
ncbi:CaiB/BaiF CoA transferase family protein [Brevibacterium luteolum]|uniref:CaiB/BaiF CoA transferase family protein n=1 Tax=Brevibacterium luteolum TaxID=199591 RepID=UPI00223B9F10|nr:CoA transferase [Brevibacterium luteolum]MCT1658284.1 CoA transferase [Brevibacterium luteolum]